MAYVVLHMWFKVIDDRSVLCDSEVLGEWVSRADAYDLAERLSERRWDFIKRQGKSVGGLGVPYDYESILYDIDGEECSEVWQVRELFTAPFKQDNCWGQDKRNESFDPSEVWQQEDKEKNNG